MSNLHYAKRETNEETRIFYVRLSDELNDLAGLNIPINLLYDRFDPIAELKPLEDNRTAAEKESS
jgi:hypothetical protein